MLPEARCTHLTPGRMRLKLPLLKGNMPALTRLAERLGSCGAVERVEISPVTGSLLLFHRDGAGEICRFAAEAGLFRLTFPGNGSIAGATVALYREIDGRLMKATGGALSAADASFLALVGAGVWQFARGKFAAPAWYTAFWYALNIFLKAHGGERNKGGS